MGIRIQKKVSGLLQELGLRTNKGGSGKLLVQGQWVDRGNGSADSKLVRETPRIENDEYIGDLLASNKDEKQQNTTDSKRASGIKSNGTNRPRVDGKNARVRNFVQKSKGKPISVAGIHVIQSGQKPLGFVQVH